MLRSEKKFLLGIDIGTSACKAAVFDLEGRVVAQSTKSYNVYYPAPGWVEQDPGEWWAGVCGVVKETLDQGKIDPAHIAGIGIDGQSWSAPLTPPLKYSGSKRTSLTFSSTPISFCKATATSFIF